MLYMWLMHLYLSLATTPGLFIFLLNLCLMAVLNPEYDIDINGLDNLFDGVVAFVEVRTDLGDISNDIAKEMKQMGATISEKRDSKVTHVIFKNGTYRTSNWAKKHDILLVSVGWIAACARSKMLLLSTPWREDYLEEVLDEYGLKKRIRYKKYCKWTNADEYEADLNRSIERAQKRMNKSLNKSQAKESSLSDNNEYERVMKLSDPCLRPRPPTPEFIKKHQRRHERLRLGGRYSWESSDEDKGNTSTDDSEKFAEASLVSTEKIIPAIVPNGDIGNFSGSVNEITHVKSLRRLFNNENTERETLIEPVRKKHRKRSLNRVIPKAVLTTVDMSDSPVSARKRPASTENCPPIKKIKLKEMELDLSVILPVGKAANNLNLIETPVLKTTKSSPTKIPLSPLITNKPSAVSTPQSRFVTPITKRKSLRTRLLQKSAKKQLKHRPLKSDNEFTDSDNSVPGVLVPETELAERRKLGIRKFLPSSPTDLYIVPETPQSVIAAGHVINTPSSSENLPSDSMTSSILEGIFETPNASRFLNKIIPNRVKSQSHNHPLFVIKTSYDHYMTSIKPTFKNQIKTIAEGFPLKPIKQISEILNNQKVKVTEDLPRSRPNVRRSIRLSKSPAVITDEMDIFKPDQPQTDTAVILKVNDAPVESVEMRTKCNTRRTRTAKELAPVTEPIIDSRAHLKRAWSQANPEKITKQKVKPKKETLTKKTFRDSTDDFVFNLNKKRKTTQRASISTRINEIVIVGLVQDEVNSLRCSCARLGSQYKCVDMVRTKEQLIVVPDRPRYSLDMIKAFIYGNSFVSLSWLEQSISASEWQDHARYKVDHATLISHCPAYAPTTHTTAIFADYSPMYISTGCTAIPKYKLRLIIEQSGGTVTDSFRQAGIVLDTRKVNALSVSSAWILDSVKQGRVADEREYLIT